MDIVKQYELDHVNIILVNDSLPDLAVDAIVYSDDIYLTRQGGVSAAVSVIAGEMLDFEISKQHLPAKLGDVLLTGAGQLKAQYVLHAITIGFSQKPEPDILIATLINKIISISTVLRLNSLALPLIGTKFAGIDIIQGFDLIFRAVIYRAFDELCPLSTIIISLFNQIDLSQIEEYIDPIIEKYKTKKRTIEILEKAKSLNIDKEIDDLLENRILDHKIQAKHVFYFDSLDQNIKYDLNCVNKIEDRKEALRRLYQIIDRLQADFDHKQHIQATEIQRSYQLDIQKATKGISAEPELIIELRDIASRLEQRAYEIQQLETQLALYRKEVSRLQA